MSGRVQDQVVLVSGAARGQGEAEARLLVAEGAQVVVADVLDDLGGEVAASIGDAAAYVHLDVRDPQQWDAAVTFAIERFGRLTALVNNAGILRHGSVLSTTPEAYREVIEVNQIGCFLGMHAATPRLIDAGGGSIARHHGVDADTEPTRRRALPRPRRSCRSVASPSRRTSRASCCSSCPMTPRTAPVTRSWLMAGCSPASPCRRRPISEVVRAPASAPVRRLRC